MSYAAALLEAARDGIVMRDADGRILDANRRFCEMTGLARDDLVGSLPPLPFWPPGETGGPDTVEELRRSGAEGRRTTFRRADGTTVAVTLTAVPFTTEAGGTGVVETVTEA